MTTSSPVVAVSTVVTGWSSSSLGEPANSARAPPALPVDGRRTRVARWGVAEAMPPRDVLRVAGLEEFVVGRVGRGHRVWIATTSDRSLVIRRCADDAAAWLHPLLSALAVCFPAPKPLALFAGRSFLQHPSGTWEALSMLPGREIGFKEQPPLHEVGAFLAAFHEISLDVTSASHPRVGGLPLRHLHEMVDWHGAERTMGSPEGVAQLRRLVDVFAADLERVGYADLRTCVVHGDPTTFNVLADGDPPHPSGLIDFELADVEGPVADIAFCLWRSGRPAQEAKELDLAKVRDFVAGYQSVRLLSDQEIAAIPVCLRGRGLQMLAKRTQLAISDDGPLAELSWIEAHHRDLAHAIRSGS